MIETGEGLAHRGYEAIKALKRDLKCRVADLLALAEVNDPFYAGQPAQQAKAAWFAALWDTYAFATGVHLRRIHYRLVSQERPPLKPDGKPYENTLECWGFLNEASKAARYLGLVSPDAFEDHRNPLAVMPETFGVAPTPPAVVWSFLDEPWTLPTLAVGGVAVNFRLPSPLIEGYDYTDAAQPYHLEIWAEKSTMDDILAPLCRRYHAVLSTALGFQSITRVINFLQRVQRSQKPTRVFYLSDFDPAGDQMPVAVARQIEFWASQYVPEAEIKLTPLLLTRTQVHAYRLPRIPIKESDRRKGQFEDRYGEGAVELDALEALYPGVLATLIEAALLPYHDADLARRYQSHGRAAEWAVRQAWVDHTALLRADVAALQAEVETVLAPYQAVLDGVRAQMEAALAPFEDRLSALRLALETAQATFAPPLPDCPEGEADPGAEAGWLFDATRSYLDQLAHYKARKARTEADKEDGDAVQ